MRRILALSPLALACSSSEPELHGAELTALSGGRAAGSFEIECVDSRPRP